MLMFSRFLTLAAVPTLLLLLTGNCPVFADEDTSYVAELLVEHEEPLLTVTRSPRPASKIAENVTVVTAEQIEKLNAHTVGEVLSTVSGIQFDRAGRTPGMWDTFSIQGAVNSHILILIDGVGQNAGTLNMADLGFLPVQQIERIEIIKGGASAAWGQALGGVINIVTKSPDPEKPFRGATFSSIGDRFTTDQRAEVSGTLDRFGYYLSGGFLHSDGLLGNNGINENNVFGKLVYDLPAKGSLTLTVSNINAQRGIEEVPPPDDWHDNESSRKFSSTLLFAYPLAERLNLELLTHYEYFKEDARWGFMTTPDLFMHMFSKDTIWGAKGKLIWGDSRLNLTTGLEYERNQLENRETIIADPAAQYNRGFNRYGIYANGTLSFGPVTVLPGIRYDRVDADHNEVSYTLGTTWRLTDRTVLRAYFARGYSRTTSVTDNAAPQKGWTVQTGVETSEVPYLWFKGTLFYNDTWNMDTVFSTGLALPSQIRQGVEIEGRTVPLYGFSLSAGYTLTDLRDKESRTRAEKIPGDLLKLALIYDKRAWGFHGMLTGNYVWWNSPAGLKPEDRNFLWNLHLTQKLRPGREESPELFLTVWNLGNNAQYQEFHYTNAGRWLEGGVRFTF